MDYHRYISEISYRFIKPHYPIPISEDSYNERLARILRTGSPGWLEKMGVWVEFMNTAFPEQDRLMKQRLRKLCRIPKMSTLAIGGMINRGVSQMADGEVFVNVGVWQGFTFLCGMMNNSAKMCIGVDNFSEFGGPRDDFLGRFNKLRSRYHHFHEMNYLDYFATVHRERIGFYIYDGAHNYEDQLEGLKAAEPFFSENCIILVDDTNWDEPREATLDFISQSANTYQVLLDMRTNYNCHPTVWNGVLVFQRVGVDSGVGGND